jgi:hypothetical protein
MEPDRVEVPSPTEVAVALDVLGRLAREAVPRSGRDGWQSYAWRSKRRGARASG